MKTVRTSLLLFIVTFPILLFGQSRILDRTIDLNLSNVQLEVALKEIGEVGKFYFSYNPNHFKGDRLVSVFAKKQKLVSILPKLLGEDVQFKESGNHLILTKKNSIIENQDVLPKSYQITGIVIDKTTGKVLSKVTVYDINKKWSALSNKNGHYKINVASNIEYVGLRYSKVGFRDTIIIVQPRIERDFTIQISPRENIETIAIETSQIKRKKQVEQLPITKLFVPKRQRFVNLNLNSVMEYVPTQLSILPGISTNRYFSGSMTNAISINLLSGYSNGLKGLEVGGLVNIVRNDAIGLQFSGGGNIVGGSVYGLQIAGLFNNNRGSIYGAQISGLSNIVLDTIIGFQASGISNILKGTMYGTQIAGISNLTTENVDGVQIAGISNIAYKDVRFAQIAVFSNYGRNVGGAQISGFSNIAKENVNGIQIGGFWNYAKSVNAAQISSVLNICRGEVKGTQISAFLNIGKKIGGHQFGLINICDSVGGSSIGLFNYIKTGFHKLEISSNEVSNVNLSFKTGKRNFYNIFIARAKFSKNAPYWGIGYGIGTSRGKKKHLNFELTSNLIYKAGFFKNYKLKDDFILANQSSTMWLNRFEINYSLPLFKSSCFLTVGPSFNVGLAAKGSNIFNELLIPKSLQTFSIDSESTLRTWLGGQVAFQF